MLSLFWCNNNTNIATTNISTITPFTPRRQQRRHSHHDATFNNYTTTIFATRHSTRTARSRSPRDGWKERGGSSKGAERHLPPEYLPRESPARISPARIFLWIVVVLGEKGEGWRSSPEWRMRGVTRPGRRNALLRDFSGNAAKGGWSKERGGAQGGAKG